MEFLNGRRDRLFNMQKSSPKTQKTRQVRGQRISRSDLIKEARGVLKEAGVGNNSRAKYIRMISEEVVGSDKPIFCQLQPNLKPHESQAWLSAFALVFQYLAENKLVETRHTIETEFGQGEVLEDIGTQNGTADDQLQQLIENRYVNEDNSFKKRVAEYTQREEQRLADAKYFEEEESDVNYQDSQASESEPINEELSTNTSSFEEPPPKQSPPRSNKQSPPRSNKQPQERDSPKFIPLPQSTDSSSAPPQKKEKKVVYKTPIQKVIPAQPSSSKSQQAEASNQAPEVKSVRSQKKAVRTKTPKNSKAKQVRTPKTISPQYRGSDESSEFVIDEVIRPNK